MNLIVVESPTKARTISRFLGKDYFIEATRGHIKDLPKSKLGIDIEKDFEPQYMVVAKKKEVIERIKKMSESADRIFLATDPDREGEAIAKHVEDVLCDDKGKNAWNKGVFRIVFHEITKNAIDLALQHPRPVDINLVDAQVARRVLDRLVGYKLSPLLWKKVRRGLSAGRVQSVAVRLIVEREKEIEAFQPKEYWEIFCDVSGLLRQADRTNSKVSNSFRVRLIGIGDKSAVVENKQEADKIVSELEKSSYEVSDVRKRETINSPYPPFTTSTMSQAAARIFGWSAKRTMSVAQKLYEEGLITYHRTDSVSLASSAIDKVREFIYKNYGENYLPSHPRIFKKTSKLAQEAHEAIRPTDVNVLLESANSKNTGEFSHDEVRLYGLIWRRFVACQMRECVFDETIIDVIAKSPQIGSSYLLRASGKVMKFDGWRKVVPLSKGEDPELPPVERGDALSLDNVLSEQKFTQPPSRYSEATLIKTLEKLGIGRPSTYAPIISTIQARNYVEKREGKFRPTSLGVAVNDFLVSNFPDIVDYPFTAEMEKELDDIAKGELEWRRMISSFYGPFEKKLEDVERNSQRVKIEVEALGKKCPTCEKEGRVGDKQGELVIRTGRFGKFVSCSLFPECKHTEKYIEKLNIKCPECKIGDVVIKTTNKGKRFYGCSRYPECKWASWRKPGISNSNGE
jgi:DNA topoisomerase-1